MSGREPDVPTVPLERWDGPIASDDPDANFKREVATYSRQDPLLTLRNMGRNLDVPVGALARYVLAKWAAAGSEALLELGPSVVDRMAAVVAEAEEQATEAARLQAYERLRHIISWLRIPLDDPSDGLVVEHQRSKQPRSRSTGSTSPQRGP